MSNAVDIFHNQDVEINEDLFDLIPYPLVKINLELEPIRSNSFFDNLFSVNAEYPNKLSWHDFLASEDKKVIINSLHECNNLKIRRTCSLKFTINNSPFPFSINITQSRDGCFLLFLKDQTDFQSAHKKALDAMNNFDAIKERFSLGTYNINIFNETISSTSPLEELSQGGGGNLFEKDLKVFLNQFNQVSQALFFHSLNQKNIERNSIILELNEKDGIKFELIIISKNATNVDAIFKLISVEEDERTLFLRELGHEIGNGLFILSTALQYLDKVTKNDQSKKLNRKVNISLRATNRIENLANVLRLIPKEKEDLKKEQFQLVPMIEIIKADYSQKINQSSVDLKIKITKGFSLVANKVLLSQVLSNLIKNSISALSTTAHPRITVTAEQDEENSLILIQDNGPGVCNEKVEKLFNSNISTKDSDTGTGIGLPFCHKLIALHGGNISYSKENGSTVFKIILPKS